jgi:hypothetical protein
MLYAGTSHQIPRRSWDIDSPDISVQALREHEAQVTKHFSLPEVQKIGSTSCCGCDFPWVMFQNGGWPTSEDENSDEELMASELVNRMALVGLLRTIQNGSVELYGVWAGGYADDPQGREKISLERILDSDFRFKERRFYEIALGPIVSP